MSLILLFFVLVFWLVKVRPFLKSKGIRNYVGANPLQMLFADWSELSRVARDCKCKKARVLLNTMNIVTSVSVILFLFHLIMNEYNHTILGK